MANYAILINFGRVPLFWNQSFHALAVMSSSYIHKTMSGLTWLYFSEPEAGLTTGSNVTCGWKLPAENVFSLINSEKIK